MTSEQKKQALLVVLVIIAIAVVVYQLFLAGGATTTSTGQSQQQTQQSAQDSAETSESRETPDVQPVTFEEVDVDIDELLESIQVVTFDYALERQSRNPMSPLVGATVMADSMPGDTQARVVDVLRMDVNGIIWDPYDPLAVVDDMVVHVGFTFEDGIRVHAITPTSVIFLVGDALVSVEMEDL